MGHRTIIKNHEITIVESGLHKIKLVNDKDKVVSRIRREGNFEPLSLRMWRRLAAQSKNRDEIMVDIGAYTGLYAIVAAVHGAKVMAFEPMENNYKRMMENIHINEAIENAIPFMCALSGKHCLPNLMTNKALYFNDKVALTSGASLEPSQANPSGYFEKVRCLFLDGLKIPMRISAMKIDVEGHEFSVIKGAVDTILRDRPTVILELLNRNHEKQNIIDFFKSNEYEIEHLEGSNWVCLPSTCHRRIENVSR